MKDIWHLTVPEWRKLDPSEHELVYKAAVSALGWRRWIPFLAAPLMGAIVWLKYPYSLMIIFSAGLLPALLTHLAYRAALRRACWAILAARGEPICTACGYNLTGNVSGRCPECGEEAESET